MSAAARGGGPPFCPGNRVVDRDYPSIGSLIVTACPWTRGHGHWRVEARHSAGRSWRNAPAAAFVLAPPDWTDPPPQPVSERSLLESSTDGPLTSALLAEARRADDAWRADRVEWALGMADWWLVVGAQVNPDLAERQARGLRRLAAMLVEEG